MQRNTNRSQEQTELGDCGRSGRGGGAGRRQQHPPNWPRLMPRCQDVSCSCTSLGSLIAAWLVESSPAGFSGLCSCETWKWLLINAIHSFFSFLRHNFISRLHHPQRAGAALHPRSRGAVIKAHTCEDIYVFVSNIWLILTCIRLPSVFLNASLRVRSLLIRI